MRAFFYAWSQSMSIILNSPDPVTTVVVILVIALVFGCFLRWFDRRPAKRRRDLIALLQAIMRK